MVGASAAIIGVSAVSARRGWTTTIDPLIVLAAPAIGLVTGVLAGIIPAIRASRTPPADTLRG